MVVGLTPYVYARRMRSGYGIGLACAYTLFVLVGMGNRE